MKKKCDTCGGSGQIGHFQGVSRFVITWDECLECNGTGVIETSTENTESPQEKSTSTTESPMKKNDNSPTSV